MSSCLRFGDDKTTACHICQLIMPSFFITGVLGSGKGLVAVGRIFEYLKQGRKVATNMDIFLNGYYAPQSKKTVMRLPDKPTLFDLQAIGSGCDGVVYDENGSPSYDEEQHGLIVLDELGSWFNSRNWQEKGRKELNDWFIHARKSGWDTLFIIQDIDSVDGQLRGMLCEHLVICSRLDRVQIPFVGKWLKLFGLSGKFPKIHRGRVYYGDTQAALLSEVWTYIGKQFYKAYNTKQKFTSTYPHGVHSVLSPWHRVGRYLEILTFKENLHKLIEPILQPDTGLRLPLKSKHPLVEKIMRLPDPNQRMEFFRRFEACGSLAKI